MPKVVKMPVLVLSYRQWHQSSRGKAHLIWSVPRHPETKVCEVTNVNYTRFKAQGDRYWRAKCVDFCLCKWKVKCHNASLCKLINLWNNEYCSLFKAVGLSTTLSKVIYLLYQAFQFGSHTSFSVFFFLTLETPKAVRLTLSTFYTMTQSESRIKP